MNTNTTKKNPLSPEQKAAVLEALKDPEKKLQVSAVLKFELLNEENRRIVARKIAELLKEQGIDVNSY